MTGPDVRTAEYIFYSSEYILYPADGISHFVTDLWLRLLTPFLHNPGYQFTIRGIVKKAG